jgi:hypothetical protein
MQYSYRRDPFFHPFFAASLPDIFSISRPPVKSKQKACFPKESAAQRVLTNLPFSGMIE